MDAQTSQTPLINLKQFKKDLPFLTEETHKNELENISDTDVRFIDLFAGIGGIRRSFEDAGARCVFSSEIDVNAQYTYYSNYGVVPFGDIKQIDTDAIPDHDILCAGFPCQPFSYIGQREGFEHPTQGTMFHEILRILTKKRPKVVFLENVPGLLNHDEGRTLAIILESLSKLGYVCSHTLLNSKDFGVPQSRSRFYLVGVLAPQDEESKGAPSGRFTFPVPPDIHVDIGDYLESNVEGYSVSEYFQKSYLFKKDDGLPTMIDKTTKGPARTLCATYYKIQRLTGSFVRDGSTGVRTLSVNECKAMMGFPEDFIIPVCKTQMYRQLGNSVVVTVVTSIAKKIMADIFPEGRRIALGQEKFHS